MNKYVTVFVAAAMLAMSGAAYATKTCPPGHEKIGSCVDGDVVPYPGDNITNNYNGPTNTGSIAGAAAGAAVVDSGNATVGNVSAATGPVSATGGNANATLGTVSGYGNSLLSPEANNTNLNTDVNTNTVTTSTVQGQQQGQLQGQVAFGGDSTVKVGDTTVEGSTSSSTLNVAAGAVQGSQTQTATGGQGGSIVINGNAVGEGGEGSGSAPFSSSATATVAEGAVQGSQTQTATGGNVEQGAVANNVDVNVTVEQPEDTGSREIAPVVKNVLPAASAAPSFASICTSGAAGQSTTYGFSLATTSATCRHLMAADALMAVGDREKAMKHVYAAAKHASVKGFMSYITTVVTLGIIE